jgi:hypothetical protein
VKGTQEAPDCFRIEETGLAGRGLGVTVCGCPAVSFALAVVLGFSATRCGYATKDISDRIALTTSRQSGAFTVAVECLAPCRAEDLRLKFSRTPPFNGTEAGSVPLIHVFLDQRRQAQMVDYMTNQDDDTFHIAFLAHGLYLKAGDRLTVRLDVGTHDPALASADWSIFATRRCRPCTIILRRDRGYG